MRVKNQRSVVLIVDLAVRVVVSVTWHHVGHEPNLGVEQLIRSGGESPSFLCTGSTRLTGFRGVNGILEAISLEDNLLVSYPVELSFVVLDFSDLCLEGAVNQVSDSA